MIIICDRCGKKFDRSARCVNHNKKFGYKNYCNKECMKYDRTKSVKVECKNCKKVFLKQLNQIKQSKNNNFCSRSCSATYNNTHKSSGTRRSKLEKWIESQLSLIYPKLEIHFNQKDTINSELDIYIPSLKLAFELNGIFHYEPIFGEEKLNHIQNNDNRKYQACLEREIELCIIDTTSQKYFKPKTAQKFLDIIVNIINYKSS